MCVVEEAVEEKEEEEEKVDPMIQIREEDSKRCEVARLLIEHGANPNHKEQKDFRRHSISAA